MNTSHPSIDPLLVHKLAHDVAGEFAPSAYFPLLDQLFEAIKQTAPLPLPARIMKPKRAPRWLARHCNLPYKTSRIIVESWKHDRHIRFNTIDDWQFYRAATPPSD